MRTFTKDGETRTASTPAAAVALKFDGWREITGTDEQPQQTPTSTAPVKRAAKPRTARKPRTIPTK